MADYWRRRPVIKAMQFTGDIEALRAWITANVDPDFCVILNNIVVSAQGDDGFVVNWDEGYLGAETMIAEGVFDDFLIIESCWFTVLSPAEFIKTYEPVV